MYISVSDAATKFNISKRRVQLLCEQGRISGAIMVSGVWLIPETASKPVDGRRKLIDTNQLSIFDVPQKALTVDDVCFYVKCISYSLYVFKRYTTAEAFYCTDICSMQSAFISKSFL